ncbi:hypothetical protein B0H14DRAFT_3515627 [Mycena olivaceomarginata]|nr:hypothetical protein B0H14DRAFT_3515627 [Mycena olivaceomarginata]
MSILDLPSLKPWDLTEVGPRTIDDVHLLTLFFRSVFDNKAHRGSLAILKDNPSCSKSLNLRMAERHQKDPCDSKPPNQL